MRLKKNIIYLVVVIIMFLFPFFRDVVYYPFNKLIVNENVVLELNKSIEDENIELKRLVKIDESLVDFDVIYASCVSRNKNYWYNTININKGSKDGVDVDMAVISADGLVGRIESVTKYSSVVKLISSTANYSKISVSIDGVNLIMDSYSDGYLLITLTNKDIQINTDSSVVTTGMGGVFPKGILIGYVDSVIDRSDMVGKVIRVKPSANLGSIGNVLVLRRV